MRARGQLAPVRRAALRGRDSSLKCSVPTASSGPPMPSVPPETVVEQLRWRYATKKFDPTRTIPKDAWSALEQALVLTPPSYGLQPCRPCVVTDAPEKAQVPARCRG